MIPEPQSGDGERLLPGRRRAPLPPDVQAEQDELLDDFFPWLKREAYREFGHLLVDSERVTLQAVAEVFARWEDYRAEEIRRHLYEAVMDLAADYRDNLPDPRYARPICEDLAPIFGTWAGAQEVGGRGGGKALVESLYEVDRLPLRRREAFHARAVFDLDWKEAARVLGVGQGALRTYYCKARRDLMKVGVDVEELTEFLSKVMRRS
ncbi:RNA polymerase sigma factor [Actinomycetota bacterium Odt1-20B]